MRRVALASLLLVGPLTAKAQGAIHEYRPEIVLTSPRFYGYGVQLLLEQHLETSDLAPNENIAGIGLVSPTVIEELGVRVAVEARQVKRPTELEHRYIPTVFSAIPLGAGFEARNRTRVEIRDIEGTWSQRWQDRTAVGHDIRVIDRPVFTYGQLDLSYDTRFSTLNRIDKTVGARVPVMPGTSLDMFFSRQDDTRRTPRVLYATGAILRVQL